MDLKTTRKGQVLIVYPSGIIDNKNTNSFEHSLIDLIDKNNDCHLLLNLKELNFISSTGLRIFISMGRRLKERNKNIMICNANDAVTETIEIINIKHIVAFFKNEDEALKSV